jgi:hypothetical protein
MYHIYCDTIEADVITPDFNHAARTFRRLIRDNPADVVTCDRIENLGAADTADDILSGNFDGRRVRVMHCDPALYGY